MEVAPAGPGWRQTFGLARFGHPSQNPPPPGSWGLQVRGPRSHSSSLGRACAVSSEHTSFLLPSSPFLGLDEKARPGPGRGRESRWLPQAKHDLPLVLFGERRLTRAAVCSCLPARLARPRPWSACRARGLPVSSNRPSPSCAGGYGTVRDTRHGAGAAATRGASACVVGIMGLSKPRRPEMGAWNFVDLLTRVGAAARTRTTVQEPGCRKGE